MRHHLGLLPLTHGWLPTTAQLLAAAALCGAVGWRTPRWRAVWVPVAALFGVGVAVAVHRYLGSLGVAGDPAPRMLWIWTALTGVTSAVVVLGWRRTRWWRRGLSIAAIPLCLLGCALALNQWVGYFPTVHSAWNQFTAGPLPDQTDRITVTAMQMTHVHPRRGVVVPVTIAADASHFAHRRELVYLPPAWFASNPPPRLPVVMMIGAELNTPADWLRAGNAVATTDAFAADHAGHAPVLVFVDPTGAFRNDTECVNGRRGNAALHLTRDVVPFMVSNFGVSADRSNWGIAGWSMGGTCAIDLSVRHPEMFSAFVDIAGDRGPNSGSKAQTIATLFNGDTSAWAQFDPATVITTHGRYDGVSGLFAIAGVPGQADPLGNPEGQDTAARSLCSLGRAHGIQCAVVTQPGRHDWPFAANAFATALPWLSGQLGTPGVPRIPLPAWTPDPPPATVADATHLDDATGRPHR
ncbi:alpha/beta hydrolase [Mycolicibacterium madagascariense]|uniref:alpha/beta hydrolase n=1 Tax=Mycolicibacterium madagascariense TaxID=212765 RepID=UPI0015D3DD14|nr:esterase family protein [Mycolicibacterium madagascariense]